MRRLFKLSACLFVTVIFSMTVFGGSVLAAEENNYILFLKPGGSKILEIENISKNIKVFISESDIVHARPLKENKIYIRGKKTGYCTVTVWDKINKEATAEIDVTVSYDLTGLKKQIAIHFPNQDIKVYGADNGIVLSGTVTGPEIVEQVIRLAERFLPSEKSGSSMVAAGEGGISIASGDDDDDDNESDVSETGRTKTSINKITNLLNVSNIHQVLLEVKVAEVSRDSSMNWSAGLSYFKMGQDFSGFANGGERDGGSFIDWNNTRNGADPTYTDFSQLDGGSIVTDFVGDFANILMKIDNVGLALEFLEGEGLGNTLAEPRLVALSGQEAKFLAGGKYPYITSTVDQNGNRADRVVFEEVGVSLKFTPIVQSNGLITLRVAPTIAEVVDTVSSPNGLLPVVDTRQLETTAQLHDGQTLVLAGLLSETSRDAVNKVPLLGDLPVLGALFRSSAFENEKTDLVITITPHLVTPTKEGLISYPGEFIKPPNRFEFYLLGKLEGMRYADDPSRVSGHNFSLQTSGGLEGSFGHIEK